MPSFEYFRKITLTTCLRNSWRGRDSSPLSLLIRFNTHATRITTSTIQTNRNHHNFFIHFIINTWPSSGLFCRQNPWSGCNSGTDLIVVLEYIFLNFVPTPNESRRFTRFRRCYVNRTAVVLTNHCQSFTAFLLDVRCSEWSRSFFFLQLWAPLICITYFCWENVLTEYC